MFRVIQLFVFVFGQIAHRTICTRLNSLTRKQLFDTSLVRTMRPIVNVDLFVIVGLVS